MPHAEPSSTYNDVEEWETHVLTLGQYSPSELLDSSLADTAVCLSHVLDVAK